MKYLSLIFLLLSTTAWTWGSSDTVTNQASKDSSDWLNQEAKVINAQATNLDPNVLKLGLTAYIKARQEGLDDKQLLTIVDYSKPSTENRLWVVDLKDNKVLFNTLVAHGKNSGTVNSTSFSNQFNSLKSSLGVFLTAQAYTGGDGYSLRMQGLESGVNDNAYQRNVVFHGAWYVSEAMAKARGMLGRSWGCMAVSQDTIRPLVNTIKDGTLVMAYYPDQKWLKTSSFLNHVV